jgi:hypothetical protein
MTAKPCIHPPFADKYKKINSKFSFFLRKLHTNTWPKLGLQWDSKRKKKQTDEPTDETTRQYKQSSKLGVNPHRARTRTQDTHIAEGHEGKGEKINDHQIRNNNLLVVQKFRPCAMKAPQFRTKTKTQKKKQLKDQKINTCQSKYGTGVKMK